MTTTITIENNMSYVDKNCPERIVPDDATCQCLDGDTPYSECHVCNGTGVDPLLNNSPGNYPFELNVCNSNFQLLMSALAIDVKLEGKIYPIKILKALRTLNSELLVSSDTNTGNFISFGVDKLRADYYIKKLSEIADEAARREELIVWH